MKPYTITTTLSVCLLLFLIACEKETESTQPNPTPSREESIPADAVKMTPETDLYPPVSLSPDWETPVPLAGPFNTAGAEDAPVMAIDGYTLFFFFTPDVRVPPEQQLLDGVSGIWWARSNNGWLEPERIILHDDLALDGPFCISADTLWFGSFRVGNYLDDGDIYRCERSGNSWVNWRNAGQQLNEQYNIGELYTANQNRLMIFHRPDAVGYGGYDLYRTEWTGSEWSMPENLGPVINTAVNESHPCVNPLGDDLYYTSESRAGYTGPAIFYSRRTDDGWSEPEEIISNFAGDPAVDVHGNIYFTHHFYSSEGEMIEADIYVAYRR